MHIKLPSDCCVPATLCPFGCRKCILFITWRFQWPFIRKKSYLIYQRNIFRQFTATEPIWGREEGIVRLPLHLKITWKKFHSLMIFTLSEWNYDKNVVSLFLKCSSHHLSQKAPKAIQDEKRWHTRICYKKKKSCSIFLQELIFQSLLRKSF